MRIYDISLPVWPGDPPVKGVVIVEGLDLSQVPRGVYDLYCLPLKLVGSDGAPARAILIST